MAPQHAKSVTLKILVPATKNLGAATGESGAAAGSGGVLVCLFVHAWAYSACSAAFTSMISCKQRNEAHERSKA
jgi:hypothetical protein